jgi:hypothetical protein
LPRAQTTITWLADDVSASPGHDIIVIGGSAGALQPLEQILRGLPANLRRADARQEPRTINTSAWQVADGNGAGR